MFYSLEVSKTRIKAFLQLLLFPLDRTTSTGKPARVQPTRRRPRKPTRSVSSNHVGSIPSFNSHPQGCVPSDDTGLRVTNSKARKSRRRKNDPMLYELWTKVRREYFPDRPDIDSYQVIFATRPQKRVLASCCTRNLRIRVAPAFHDPNLREHLEALLYHEMCHAILGELPTRRGRRIIHGREFKMLERRHHGISALDEWIKDGGWKRAYLRQRRAHQALQTKPPQSSPFSSSSAPSYYKSRKKLL